MDEGISVDVQAPTLEPQEDEIKSDTKGEKLLNGELTNSMATGEPKEYAGTSSGDPENGGDDYPAADKEDKPKDEKSPVDVSSIMKNCTDTAEAATSIAASVTEAIAVKSTAIVGEYSAKMIALPTTVPSRIAQYTQERFNKTKDDKDDNGQPYNPVKISLGDALDALGGSAEDKGEEDSKQQDETKKTKREDEAKKKAQKFVESAKKVAEKSAETIGNITSHIAEGAQWVQQNVDKEIARAEKNIRKELETGYLSVEKNINDFCKNEGDKLGAQLVEKYNNTIKEQAKDIVDKKKKAEQKAKTVAAAAAQKAKLKLFALIGL